MYILTLSLANRWFCIISEQNEEQSLAARVESVSQLVTTLSPNIDLQLIPGSIVEMNARGGGKW